MKLSFLSLFSIIGLFSYQSAFACSCMEWESAKVEMSRSDAVFIGVPSQNTRRLTHVRSEDAKTSFNIVRSFKGLSSKTVNLYTNWTAENDGANCGKTFRKDDGIYIIMADKVKGKWVTSQCSVSSMGANREDVNNFVRDLVKLTKVK